MSTVSKVLRSFDHGPGDRGFAHYCLPCGGAHRIWTEGKLIWTFNGNVDAPTFSPSLKHTRRFGGVFMRICHYFIEDGLIKYQADCTHELAGQTVEMSPAALISEAI
jgi:hypothetical protein